MASSPIAEVFRRLCAVREGGQTDGELLEAFVQRRDEPSFASLVRRHGPMVLGVCRRLLGHHHDAEDAFQATFLVLARKAGTIRPPDAVGGWLHGVAWRTARSARQALARRRARELAAGHRSEPASSDTTERDEMRTVLDREVNRLPEKYRVVVVLCELEGRSRKDVAVQLDVPEGTLSSRLATARKLLARRLSARTLALMAPAVVPAALEAAVVPAAVRFAAAAPVMALTRGVMHMMVLTKLRGAVLALLVMSLGAVGVARFAAAEPPPLTTPAAIERIAIAEPAAAPDPAAAPVADDGVTVASVPPVVVKTVPEAGVADVDPALKEIKVTFSKKMADKSWSWSTLSKETFPKMDGDPRYEADGRTCVLPVKLEAGKTYAIWVNSEKFTNFKDADGKSAVPYLLVFQTKKK